MISRSLYPFIALMTLLIITVKTYHTVGHTSGPIIHRRRFLRCPRGQEGDIPRGGREGESIGIPFNAGRHAFQQGFLPQPLTLLLDLSLSTLPYQAEHLASLGVNAVELLPVFEWDELEFQRQKNARDHMVNIWGYSHMNFFAPMSRFAAGGAGPAAAAREFKEMVKK